MMKDGVERMFVLLKESVRATDKDPLLAESSEPLKSDVSGLTVALSRACR